MDILRKVGRVISGGVFKLALVAFASSLALWTVIGTPDPLKTGLNESGAYETAIDSLLETARGEQSEADDGLPLDRPQIRDAAKRAFSPDLLRRSAEEFIDGTYGWLEGETAQPEFTIDLSGAKTSFIQEVADYAENRARRLRACTAAENLQLSRQGVDPFDMPCRPPAAVIQREKQRLINQLEGDSGILDKPVLTGQDLGLKDSTDLEGWQNAYGLLGRLPLIAAVIGLLAAGGVILLHDDRRRGVRQIGMTLLGSGLLVLLSGLAISFIFSRIRQGGADMDALQLALFDTLGHLAGLFSRQLIIMSLAYLAVAAAILAYLRFTDKRKREQNLSDRTNNVPSGKMP